MSDVFPWESAEHYCSTLEFEFLLHVIEAEITFYCQRSGLDRDKVFHLVLDDYGDQQLQVGIFDKASVNSDFYSSVQRHLDIVRRGWKVVFFDSEAEEPNGSAVILSELQSRGPKVELSWRILPTDIRA